MSNVCIAIYSVSKIYDNNNLISVRAGIAKLNQLRYSAYHISDIIPRDISYFIVPLPLTLITFFHRFLLLFNNLKTATTRNRKYIIIIRVVSFGFIPCYS